MSAVRKIAWGAAILSLVSAVAGTWLAPRVISWYFEPPVSIGVNCQAATVWAMDRLIWTQLICLIFGAILGALIVAARLRSKQKLADPG
jgi:hypothetical protein